MVIARFPSEHSDLAHDIKRRNLRSLMLFLLSHRERTKLDLLQHTGLSATTVSGAINSLLAMGAVRSTGTQKSTGGRQPVVYSINNEYGAFLGIRLELGLLRITVTDMYGQPVYRRRILLDGAQSFLYALYGAIDQALAVCAAPARALALGFPGALHARRGVVLEMQETQWRNVPIKEILERRYNILTVLDSKVNQGAIYHQVLGAAKETENFLCYFAEAADRAALVLDGRLCRGEETACVALGKSAPRKNVQALVSMLGLRAVLTDTGETFEGARTVPVSVSDDFFEIAAALTAEVAWFDRLYALQTGPDE